MKWIALMVVLAPAAAFADSQVTAEVSVGLGAESVGEVGDAFGRVSPSVGASVGNWVSPRTAVGLRMAALSIGLEMQDGTVGLLTARAADFRRTFAFVGPSAQYWVDDHVWLGAGVGAAAMFTIGEYLRGWGADLRAGYAVGAFNVSVEITPSYFPTGGPICNCAGGIEHMGASSTGFALLAGYQLR